MSSPRVVTRGESIPPLPVLIDYLNFSVPIGDEVRIIRKLSKVLQADAVDRERGHLGFTRSFDFSGFAIVAYGGDRQRGAVFVSINGAGCVRVRDWAALRRWAEGLGAIIKRCDVAADDIDGQMFTVADGIKAYREGQFQLAGKPPKARLIDDLGSGDGSTLYVGSRMAGKSFKLYEKGKQLGDKLSKWARVEVEFYGKDRIVPWDIISTPGAYLAASYPFLHALSLVHCMIRTCRKAAEITVAKATAWLRTVGGRTLNMLLADNGGDIGDLVTRLRRGGVPKRLSHWFDPATARAYA